MLAPLLACFLLWQSRVHTFVNGWRESFTGALPLSPAAVLFRQRRPFYSLPQLLMQVGLWATAWALCGQLWIHTGMWRRNVGRARVCAGGCSAGRAQSFFVGVLCWLRV